MKATLGTKIATLRKEKGLKQDDLAQMLNVSAQAVSKWENDQTCPDISLLPHLARILKVSVDDLLSGEIENQPDVKMVQPEERKDINNMMLRIIVDSEGGDKVKINLPLALVKMAIDMGVEIPQVSGNDTLKSIDFNKIIELVNQGVVGNLLEVESQSGDVVRILVE
ncbi:MAG: helix-turn-helix transcriptional regulator [Clostridia bacterium]|nr:helix-turn-helix transcriptional regulator [Clostridia bacterium]